YMLGAAGQLLDRSLVDRMVGAPERIVFEGPPVLVPPLAQDADSRRPIAVDGDWLDTAATCPSLTTAERTKLQKLKAKAERRIAPAAAKARSGFIAKHA